MASDGVQPAVDAGLCAFAGESLKVGHSGIVVLVLISVIPVGITTCVAHELVKNALMASALNHVTAIAEDHARHLNAWLQERRNDVRVLSRLPSIRQACQRYASSGSPGSMAAMLTQVLASTRKVSPSYESIYVMSLQGQVLAPEHPVLKYFSQVRRMNVLKRLKKEAFVFGNLYRSPDRKWHISPI